MRTRSTKWGPIMTTGADLTRNYLDVIPNDCGFNHIFPHIISTPNVGLSYIWIRWIAANIQGRWGWHWNAQQLDPDNCILSFENEKDAFWFALRYDFKKELDN